MSKLQIENTEALQELIGSAYTEIAEAVTGMPPQGSDDALEVCLGYIGAISKAASDAGLADLREVAEDLDTALAVQPEGLTPETAVEIVSWLSDALLHIESPEDSELIEGLLKPLPAKLLAVVLENTNAGSQPDELVMEEVSAEIDTDEINDLENQFPDEGDPDEFPAVKTIEDFPLDSIQEDNTQDSESITTFDSVDVSMPDEDSPPEFDMDSMLGMLASELYDISPELSSLSESIIHEEDPVVLVEAIGAYQELVYRVSTVSENLGLEGLVLVCDFVANNILLVAELTPAERGNSREVLQGWSQVVINHLVDPNNDPLCLAVVDYLEKSNWPQPLAYRDVRGLIEGLTRELEVSGDFEVEARVTVANAEDVELEMSEDASPQLIDAFFDESPGHAEKFSSLVEAIARGEDIQNNVEAAQRIAHTLKGSGNLVGAKGIANMSHHIEDIFEYIAKHQIAPPAALAHCMQEAADTIEVMLEYLQGLAPYPEESLRILQDVLNWANSIDSGNLEEIEIVAPTVLDDDFGENRRASDKPDNLEASVARRASDAVNVPVESREEAVRVPVSMLDNIFRVVGETAIAIGQIQEHLNRLESGNTLVRKNDVTLQQRRYELENLVSVRGMAARHRSAAAVGGDSGFDPLEMDEYDEFYGITHSYIEGVADSREILRGITEEVSDLNALFLLQQRLNKELQQMVMATRMIPVSHITARLQRAVRQVCRATGKPTELTIIGEDLLLDGEVLNKLADPLMHMLRNAVDHSIENSGDRQEKGKSEVGDISLSFQQEGNNVVVACVDDGSGLDYDRIRQKAVKNGLISEREPIDKAGLARIILQSGFSTSDEITQVSGRGVGMDVVHNTIQSLNGSMDISDAVNGGTQISLRLPITLLTSHCLLAGVGEDTVYAIPTSTLAQILSPGTGLIGDMGGKLTYQLGQDIYPAQSLGSLVGMQSDENVSDNSTVLLLQTAEGMTAVTVDKVVSSHDLVVKNMGNYVKHVRGVAGVSTLGDGSVVAVLDMTNLLQNRDSSSVSMPSASAAPANKNIELPKVLVVDDSLSVRSSLSQLMTDGGYQVITARDGIEAVDLLDKEHPDIVLTDLEMPRMNGLELTNYIRKSDQWSPLPIVMITSRTMAKHRQQAEEIGVNHYITKPFTEDDVLASIGDHLGRV